MVKTTTFYLKCANTFVEVVQTRVFFLVKKNGDREMKCLVWF